MLARRPAPVAAFTRRDAARLVAFTGLLVTVMTVILSLDVLPTGVAVAEGDIARSDIRAPRAITYISDVETKARQQEAREAVPPQYDYTPERGDVSASRQLAALARTLAPVEAAFEAVLDDAARREALGNAIRSLSPEAVATLQDMTADRWAALRNEMERVLGSAQRDEVRDPALETAQRALRASLALRFTAAERALASEIIVPLLVPNSTYDADLSAQVEEEAARAVEPVRVSIERSELVVPQGRRIDAVDAEKLDQLGLLDPTLDLPALAGWFLLSVLLVGLLLAWVWRFRPELWPRDNALLLVGLILAGTTMALEVTAGRGPIIPYFVPTAAVGLLIAILLDSSPAIVVTAIVAAIAGVVSGSVELAIYTLLGGFAGIVAVRRGERLANFVNAAAAIAVVNISVITMFALLGAHDLPGTLQLWGAAIAMAGGSAVAAIGTFNVLGNVFGITTAFQLLELGNPSYPLLRRLLLEASGTYHHSLIVGNLAERAAERVGADPLLTRVAAYYHDIGKLSNPLAYIENQGGGENVHDELSPERSAALLRQHVTAGIDLAYQNRLPKALIAFIPQHHGTAVMSYFYAKAREEAIAGARARPGPEAQRAADSIDVSKFRHIGPKPQSREAAILMLADGVEASVRALSNHDEPAIRGMVDRIIDERLKDGQFDECDITLRDLDRVRESFIPQLLGMYHRRISYPQSKVVELEARRAAGTGGGGAA